MVRMPGLEPGTSSLSVTRSNHLSYTRNISFSIFVSPGSWDRVIIRTNYLGDDLSALTPVAGSPLAKPELHAQMRIEIKMNFYFIRMQTYTRFECSACMLCIHAQINSMCLPLSKMDSYKLTKFLNKNKEVKKNPSITLRDLNQKFAMVATNFPNQEYRFPPNNTIQSRH